MKIKKSKKNPIIPVVIGTIVVLAITGSGAYYYLSHQDPSNAVPSDTHYVSNKDQPLTNGAPGKEDKVITPAQTTPSSDTAAPEKPVITRAEQSGNYIRVSTTLSQPSNGECTLTLEKVGVPTVTKSAPIIVGPSYYTCNGFRVPRSELPQSGDWVATVTHQANGKSTVSDKKTISVQ